MDATQQIPELPGQLVEDAVRAALKEDLCTAGDITTAATIPEDAVATALLVARKPGVLAGIPLAIAAFRQLDSGVRINA